MADTVNQIGNALGATDIKSNADLGRAVLSSFEYEGLIEGQSEAQLLKNFANKAAYDPMIKARFFNLFTKVGVALTLSQNIYSAYESKFVTYVGANDSVTDLKEVMNEIYRSGAKVYDVNYVRQHMNPSDYSLYVPEVDEAFYEDMDNAAQPIAVNMADMETAFQTADALGQFVQTQSEIAKAGWNAYWNNRFETLIGGAIDENLLTKVPVTVGSNAVISSQDSPFVASMVEALENLTQNNRYAISGRLMAAKEEDDLFLITNTHYKAAMTVALSRIYNGSDEFDSLKKIMTIDNGWLNQVRNTDTSGFIGLIGSKKAIRAIAKIYNNPSMTQTDLVGTQVINTRQANNAYISKFAPIAILVDDNIVKDIPSRIVPLNPTEPVTKTYNVETSVLYDNRNATSAEQSNFGVIKRVNGAADVFTKLTVGDTQNLGDVTVKRLADTPNNLANVVLTNVSSKATGSTFNLIVGTSADGVNVDESTSIKLILREFSQTV